MAWIQTLDEFSADLSRWGNAICPPHGAEWQVYFDKTKDNKIQIRDCYHPQTNEQIDEQSAIILLSDVFLSHGMSGWRIWPQYEKKIDKMHRSPVFEKVVQRTKFYNEQPHLDNIYVKLRINKDFQALGLTLDKFEIVSFHPERDK